MFIAVMLAAMQAVTDTAEVHEGSRFFWQAPCVVATADPENPVEKLVRGFLSLSLEKFTVYRCVQPAGGAAPVLASDLVGGKTFIIIYSAELEVDGFPYDALRGMIAHEVSHIRTGESCMGPFYRSLTEEEYIACESRVDREAAVLVGTDAMRAALLEYHKLQVRMTARILLDSKYQLRDNRVRMLDMPPTKKPSSP